MGAEKALFRSLKSGGKTPKYGILYNSSFIGKAGAQNKGRISRYLANKCAIAARFDQFATIPTKKVGEKLRDQVEQWLTFFATGEKPKTNTDAMKEVLEELKAEGLYVTGEAKSNKWEREEEEPEAAEAEADSDEEEKTRKRDKKAKKDKKKKKKKSKREKSEE